MRTILATLLATLMLCIACSEDDPGRASTRGPDAGALQDAGELPSPAESASPLTYWQDILPLFEQHCLLCHQAGGIGSFPLDDYAEAKRRAGQIALVTAARTMPPWSATSDGTCGTFQGSLALSDEQIAMIEAWHRAGAQEGTERIVELPQPDTLASGRDYATPLYRPQIAGGPLAVSDDYRCFPLDPGIDSTQFITGYDVRPGNAATVHHVVMTLVDPDAPSQLSGKSNAEVMKALDDASPDQLGWPCFGLAGEGVATSAVPLVWAPGQGVVRYPNRSGVPLKPTMKLVVQMHYNLADPSERGKLDTSTLRLALASRVENIGIFVLSDGLLESLTSGNPHPLAPGKPSELYSFKRSLQAAMGQPPAMDLPLWGVMPHMHTRGQRYEMHIKTSPTATSQCGVEVKQWDFHWQRMYFYDQPLRLNPESELEVTCEFDTSGEVAPVTPGWGTANEMCLATLYFTVPADALGF